VSRIAHCLYCGKPRVAVAGPWLVSKRQDDESGVSITVGYHQACFIEWRSRALVRAARELDERAWALRHRLAVLDSIDGLHLFDSLP